MVYFICFFLCFFESKVLNFDVLVLYNQAIGVQYGEGFETFRQDGPLKVDVVRILVINVTFNFCWVNIHFLDIVFDAERA